MDQPADLSAGGRGSGQEPAIVRALAIAGLTAVAALGLVLGWRLTGPAKVAGLDEIQAGLGRNLMVVYDDPQRPAVYLSATTL
jgi:hypothetical protein